MVKKKFIVFLFLFFNFFGNCYSDAKPYSKLENDIAKNLRCLICQGQSIYDSNSEFAITVKMVVKDLIKQGKTEEEIYNFLSEKYGDWILYNPKLNAGNLLLWSLPYLVLVFGGAIIVFLIRKRSKKT